MDIIAGPMIETRPAEHYLGIRMIAPFRGMLGARDRLMAELFGWFERQKLETGDAFLRLHVVDMAGQMDIEVGAIVPAPLAGDDRVRPGILPAGRYATLTYRDHALRANRALIEWAAANGLVFDRDTIPEGDRFACRYERYLTDPRTEPRKTRWIVQLNVLVRA